MRIAEKVFVVTGGGNGIGREVVLELVRRGARVAAVDRRREFLEETADLAPPGLVNSYELDIADRSAVFSLPERVTRDMGQVDGVVNVAGVIQPFVPINELDMEDIDRVMAVNFGGTLSMVKAFLPTLLLRPEASIVNVSSMGALVPFPGQGAYGASKAAVKLLTECLFAELQGTRVTVTEVFPGAVGTRISENSGVEVPVMPAGAPSRMTSAPDAAHQIVEAIEQGTFRVLIGSDARNMDRISRIAPQRAITTVARQMKKILGL